MEGQKNVFIHLERLFEVAVVDDDDLVLLDELARARQQKP
jgi:hypothetical protein